MTNQNADTQPPKQPSPTITEVGRSSAGTRAARDAAAQRRGSGALLLAVLVLITAAFAFVMLSPDTVRRWIAGSPPPPSTTISVAPPALPGAQPPANAAPRAAAPTPSAPASTAPSIPPAAPSTAPAAAAELQALRASLGDVTNRLGAIEQKAAAGADSRLIDLENRLTALDGRLAGLIEQPVVTPAVLADALIENRQSAQAVAQEAAQRAAQEAAQETVKTAVQSALQDLSRAVADLEKRTETVEKAATATAAIADLDKRLAAVEKMASAVAVVVDLERRVTTMERATPALVAIPDLERRLTGVEKIAAPLTAISQTALKGESLALGLLSLRTALDRGLPYADVLSALRVTAGGDGVLSAEMDRLAPFAATGVPTLSVLRQRLASLTLAEPAKPARTSAAEPASQASAADRTFWGEVWDRLSSVVTVRRLDANAAQSSGPGQGRANAVTLIERAAQRLAVDDLAGAAALLDSDAARRDLSGAPAAALDDWLRDAQGRLTAETAFTNLARRALALHGSAAAATVPAGDTPRGP